MNLNKLLLMPFISLLFALPAAFADTYKIDADHTTVGFKIRHLFSNVTGNFKQFEGQIQYDPAKPESWTVEAKIEAASINTNVEARDKHLKSADFFDVEKYPTITFKSTSVSDVAESKGKLNGVINLHGIEKPIVLDLQIHGVGNDPWGNTRAGFTATGKINRKVFGLAWNEKLETGQLLVGEDVEIILEVEGIQVDEKKE